MSDLISRSALLESMDDRFKEKKDIVPNNLAEGFMQMEKLIKEQPTVEAKPVVHGEWIKIKDWDENDNALFECNNCHHADTHAKSVKVPYCWYCGAKMSYVNMRGVKNE